MILPETTARFSQAMPLSLVSRIDMPTSERSLRLLLAGSATVRLKFSSNTDSSKEQTHGENDWHRPRHDQLLYGCARGIGAHRHPERRGRAHDTVRRRLRT